MTDSSHIEISSPSTSTTEGYSEQRSSSQEPPAHASAADMSTTQTAPASPIEPTSIIASASAPEMTTTAHALNPGSLAFSPSLDISLLQSSRTPSSEALSTSTYGTGEESSGPMSPPEPDIQILEALRSKDRLWVLKLGEMMEVFINEHKQCVFTILWDFWMPVLEVMIAIACTPAWDISSHPMF